MHCVHHKIWGRGGGYGLTRGGSTGTNPCGWGGGSRGLVVATTVARAEVGGGAPPPSEKGVKMFELAQVNVFPPEVRKGRASHCRFIAMCWQAMGLGGMECVGRTGTWTPTWSVIMEIGGFDPSTANREAYAGWVHGIASCPKSKPKVPATPATGGPPQPQPPPPTPGTPLPRP